MTATKSPRFYALVPCAGVGERACTLLPKQYQTVAGRSVVAHTLAALAGVSRVSHTLVVLSPLDALFEQQLPAFDGWLSRSGGATRAQTVANGLADLAARGAQAHDWVLVHDAARCLVRPQWIDELIDACVYDAVGGLLALPLADTLKQAQHGRVTGTLDRSDKWQAQTPQMFRLGVLRDALQRAGAHVTDEASAVEACGLSPLLVRGSIENFKLTYASDFALAERLLRTRE